MQDTGRNLALDQSFDPGCPSTLVAYLRPQSQFRSRESMSLSQILTVAYIRPADGDAQRHDIV